MKSVNQMNLMNRRHFYPLFWAQFFSSFNDNFLKNALIILVTFRSVKVFSLKATELVPLAGGVFILPFFLFSATAGQLADRLDKAQLIRIIKWTEIAIMGLATYGFLSERYEFLLVVLFLMGVHSAFFGPVKFSILPQCLDKGELVAGNALIEAGTFLAILLGTISGGVIVSLRPEGPLLAGVTLIATSMIGLIASLWIPATKSLDPGLVVQWNPATPTWSILKDTYRQKSVFISALGISWFWFFGAAVLSLFPTFCKETLQSNESVVTLFLGCFSVGIGIGALLCEKLSQRKLDLGLVPLGSIGMTLFTGDLYFSSQPEHFQGLLPVDFGALQLMGTASGLRLLGDLLGLAIVSGLYIVPLNTLIQSRSEISHCSRIVAGNNILNALFIVGASLFLVIMRAWLEVGYSNLFLIFAVMNAFFATLIFGAVPEFISSLRRRFSQTAPFDCG